MSKLLTVEEALSQVLKRTALIDTIRVPLAISEGRVLAQDLESPCKLPHWDNSAMDGYAVRAMDCNQSTRSEGSCDSPKLERGDCYQLEVIEVISAGHVPQESVAPGQCSRIMTGAPMPAGADSVLVQEQVEVFGDHIRSSTPVKEGQNVRKAGEEVTAGEPLLAAGTTLSPGAIGLCASVGIEAIEVRRQPRVGILSTGDEVVAAGTALEAGQIWSSNNIALSSLSREAGAEAIDLGLVGDSMDALVQAIKMAQQSDLDILLTTGGVSVGDFDYVKEAFSHVGMAMDFWKIRVKPGKPMAFGQLGPISVFGLPGNPVSCMVGFLQFVRPLIRQKMGDTCPFLPILSARFVGSWRRRPGRNEFLRVSLIFHKGELLARLTGSQGSGMVSSMAHSQGLALIDHEATHLVSGDMVHVQLVSPGQLGQSEPGYQWSGRR